MSDAKRRLFHHSRREALTVLVVAFVTLLWVVGYCYLRGYQHAPDSWLVQQGLATPRHANDLTTFLGFPDWVFWGIIVPWVGCTLFTLGFGLFFMNDDALTETAQGDAANES